ncbi:CD209 antigen-like protein 2 [Sorex fumeus]|uniref:CD209 antigen-like protein 2 n=1 Tax=Sorex fumeus TaxID=62283 RepID=UPI0024AD2C32|nr:CD209 antigen-like protein 2 [Sorex fumeus]
MEGMFNPHAPGGRGILSEVCLISVLLFVSLGLLLFQSIILVQVAAPQKQIQGDLKVINQCLARMNVTMETLCRPCPWGWEFFQGSCYWFSKSQSNWKTSESACQSMNSHLVIVNSASEEKFLQTWEVRHGQRTWIGLSDLQNEGSWQWVDGTPLELSFWKPGEPNNDGDEDCVELYNDGWNDDKCSKEKVWICEKPTVSCS